MIEIAGRLVVGVDGSAGSDRALAWAESVVGSHGGVRPVRVEDSLGVRSVAATLLATADEIGAEAVVVGHHMVARPQLVGHVTGSLLHGSAIPVVIVPSDWSSDRTDGRPVAIGVGVSRGTRVGARPRRPLC